MAERVELEVCPACGRTARPGIACRQATCPYELAVNHLGRVVLARPLRRRTGLGR